jgi:type II secretory pathway component PulK
MNNDQRGHRTAMAIFAVLLAVAMIAAFITTIEGVDTKHANNAAQSGTIGQTASAAR